MTREEAIRTIENAKHFAYDGVYEEAFDMAIKALEQAPTTKNNLEVDAISRADARSLIVDIDIKYHTFGMSRKVFKDLYNGMDELPPATLQEPRKGHWIGIDEEPHEDWECDNCGFVIWADENIEKFHYCPNCGAKMVEPQESEGTE